MPRRAAGPYSIRLQFLKVVVLATLPFFLVLGISALVFYSASQNYIEKQVESSTTSLHRLIEIQLDNSIRTYLRSKVEAGEDLIRSVLTPELPADPLDLPELRMIVDHLLDIRVGDTGYYYAIDSDGRVIFHPDGQIVGTIQTGKEPVDQQIIQREGYLEYMWQNTDESEPQRKALSMVYIPELDWIVTATSYRSEFTQMVDRTTIKEIVNDVTVGAGGYSYVVDRQGNQIAHPYLAGSGSSGLVSEAEYTSIIQRMFAQRDGYTSYLWRENPGAIKREKIVYLRYLKDFDWIVGTAIYRAEIARPAMLLVSLSIAAAFIVGTILSAYIYRINQDIAAQLVHIGTILQTAREGDLSARMMPGGLEELQEISESFNFFISSLQHKTAELQELNESLEDRVRERGEELNRTSRQLIESEKMALTSRLVAGVAHEINTPTGVAMTAVTYQERLLRELAQSYESGDLSKSDLERYIERSRESVDTVIRNLKRAGELIASFKSVSSDQITLAKRRIDLKEVIEDTLLSLRPELKRKDIRLSVQIPRINIETYPGIFVHLLVNLVTNSLNHGFVDSEGGTIDISAEESQGEILFYYQDNGVGMSRETMEHIFDPFYTTRRADGNIGLGLNIVKNLITDKLGGSIRVESREREFTRFTVRFRAEISAPT